MKSTVHSLRLNWHATLREALIAIGNGSAGILFVTDPNGLLRGSLSDGDLRRAVLSGLALESDISSFVNPNVIRVGEDASRAEVFDLMQAMSVKQIPVVDTHGLLTGVHLLQELLGATERPNWAVIMAGGRGSRLGEITQHIPKPMLRVAGRPILERLVLHFVGFGIRKIFLSVGYLADIIENHFGDGRKFGCEITYLRETEPLGTGGALSLLPSTPTVPCVVCNGDIVTQANIEEMLAFHRSHNFQLTVGLHNYSHQVPFGCVELADDHRVLEVIEKPTWERPVNAGLYIIDPSLLSQVPQRFFPITELIQQTLASQARVGGWFVNDEWIDVGHRTELARARNGHSA